MRRRAQSKYNAIISNAYQEERDPLHAPGLAHVRKSRSGARTQVRTLWRWALSSPTSYTVSASVAASNTETSAVGRSTSFCTCVSRPSGTSATTSALIASTAKARLAFNSELSCEVVGRSTHCISESQNGQCTFTGARSKTSGTKTTTKTK